MYQKILIPIDGSPTAAKALDSAIGLAKAFDAQLRLVHVVEELAYLSGYDQFGGYSGELIKAMHDNGAKMLNEGMATAKAAGVATDNMLFDKFGARLGETVAEAAKRWGADLIVVGTHGRHGIGRLLMGSGAEQIIRLAPVPVLVIRAPDEGTPPTIA